METEVGGDKPEEAVVPSHGKKRPPSPAAPSPSDDGEDSSMSDIDDDGWEFSDEEEENDDEDDQGMGPFTVDNFPRFSSEQRDTIYTYPGIHRRGPPPLSLFCAFKDYPVGVKKGNHWFRSRYRLYDESEISLNNAQTIDCLEHCYCHTTDLLPIATPSLDMPKSLAFFQPGIRLNLYATMSTVIDNHEAVSVKQKTAYGMLIID